MENVNKSCVFDSIHSRVKIKKLFWKEADMATLEWRCMTCDRTFRSDELKKDQGGTPICPYCQDYDVFPQRYFRCMQCGFEAEQSVFFPDISADLDPEVDQEGSLINNDPVYHSSTSDDPDASGDEECESYRWIQIR